MGGSKEPTVTQVPLQSPQQSQFLNMLLGGMGSYMGQDPFGQMPTLGERYGGGRPAPGSTPGGGKGGTAPSTSGARDTMAAPMRVMHQGLNPTTTTGGTGTQVGQPGEMLAKLLTGPIIEPFAQGQTGNYPRRR